MYSIEFYYEDGSNSSNRVKWILDYKKIQYKSINTKDIDLEKYKKINPMLRIPGMTINNYPLSESVAMIEFLEEVVSNPSIFPEDKIEKAKIREVCEIINATIHPVQNSKVPLFFIPSLNKQEITFYRVNWIKQNLEKLIPILFLKSNFAVGSSFTAADIFLICIYFKSLELGLDKRLFPILNNHIKHCLSFSDIKNSCPILDLK